MQAPYDHKLLITNGTKFTVRALQISMHRKKKDVVKRVRLYTYAFIARHIFRETS